MCVCGVYVCTVHTWSAARSSKEPNTTCVYRHHRHNIVRDPNQVRIYAGGHNLDRFGAQGRGGRGEEGGERREGGRGGRERSGDAE